MPSLSRSVPFFLAAGSVTRSTEAAGGAGNALGGCPLFNVWGQLEKAQEAHFTRWPILRRAVYGLVEASFTGDFVHDELIFLQTLSANGLLT